MNYRNFEILEGFRFRLDNNLLAVVEDSDNLTIYINEKKYCFKINSTEFVGHFNNIFIVKDIDGIGYKLNLDTLDLDEIDNSKIKFYDKNQYNLFPIYRSQSIFEPTENGVYDILSNSVKFISKDCKSTEIIDNFYVGSFDGVLFSNSLNMGEELWQFSLSLIPNNIPDEDKHAELVSFLGIYKNILWILITDTRLIGLNIETGILLHEIHLCESLGLQPQTTESYTFSLGDIHLDQEKGSIKGFAHRYYWELDLNNLQAEIKVDFGAVTSHSWRIKKSKFYKADKNLYFTGAKNGETFDRAIGIFDTEKLEITWYDEPLGEGRYLFFTDIQANDKLLGALDSEQNLRIYERLETEK